MKDFATKEKLHIVCFMTESRTAKVPGRPVFEKMIKMIENGEANGILSWHPFMSTPTFNFSVNRVV